MERRYTNALCCATVGGVPAERRGVESNVPPGADKGTTDASTGACTTYALRTEEYTSAVVLTTRTVAGPKIVLPRM